MARRARTAQWTVLPGCSVPIGYNAARSLFARDLNLTQSRDIVAGQDDRRGLGGAPSRKLSHAISKTLGA